jgi:hypothetical protein
MEKMIEELRKDGINVLTRGYAAHHLNLFAHDLSAGFDVNAHDVAINKYLRTHHMPKCWFELYGGTQLKLPLNVGWNTVIQLNHI